VGNCGSVGEMTMDDIVVRLRTLASQYHQHRPHYQEAAAEIERLRSDIDYLNGQPSASDVDPTAGLNPRFNWDGNG
jgi:hypothetical protein